MAEANRHDVVKTSIIVREPLKEIPDRKLASEMALFHVNNLVYGPHRVNRIVYMAMDFKAATDALFARTGVEDLAEEIGCSPQTLKQARMAEETAGRRSPPPGWEAAAARLAKRKAEHFRRLAERLSAA